MVLRNRYGLYYICLVIVNDAYLNPDGPGLTRKAVFR